MSTPRGVSPQAGPRAEDTEDRPYRSHARPACMPCRKRKSRCKLEAHSAACLTCRAHGTECDFPPEKRRKTRPRSSAKRVASGDTQAEPHSASYFNQSITSSASVPHLLSAASEGNVSISQPGPAWPSEYANDPPLSLEGEDDNPHILGPAGTSDSHVLADYLSSIPGGYGMRAIRPVELGGSSPPIVFTKVQKRPLGMTVNSNPTLQKLQVIEKLIEPWSLHLVDLYLKKIDPCLPLLDQVTFREQYVNSKDSISPALLSCLYAHVLAFWRHDPQLSHVRCPDHRFIWNLANEALYSELLVSPGISTIAAILLNVGGRPTTSMIGNGVQLGSAVSLCHSLGLNRNPLTWDIPEAEKHLRMKLWWAVLVHDRWTSLAYGTPPHIKRTQHDVPTPTKEYLGRQGNEDKAHNVFIALFKLTDILDHCLERMYGITAEGARRDLELKLWEWVESVKGDIRKIVTRGVRLDIPGAANLRLAFLAIILLLRRLEVDAERHGPDNVPEKMTILIMRARQCAEDVVVFVQELEKAQLADFWLPVAAFTFSSTVTFLVRCAVENEQTDTGFSQSASLLLANDLLTSLKSHQRDFGWDLADICLAQHSEVVEKLLTYVPSSSNADDTMIDSRLNFVPDTAFIDVLFPNIWDTLQSM